MEIKCPHCNQIFDLNDDVANHIREQIRTKEFDKEIEKRMLEVNKSTDELVKHKVAEAVSKEKLEYERKLAESDKKMSDAETKISQLKSKLDMAQTDAKLESMKAVEEKKAEYEKKLSESQDKLTESNNKIMKLESELETKDLKHEYAIKDVKSQLIDDFNKQLLAKDYEIKIKEDEIEQYRDMKSRMSTKMVGESLEVYCSNEFDKVRPYAFKNAEFEKDNLVSKESGSKGDFIFREYDEDGIEIISIMFEMKNEMDTTATKKKNEYFFKELDKDRREKNCEYAILVSLLEADNDVYNQGIVDVSHRYDKMYVVRPQFFIPIIGILRNAALNSLANKKELLKIQNENLDVANFKTNFETFQKGFCYNYEQSGKRLDEAVEEIDKVINKLQTVRDSLTKSNTWMSKANAKLLECNVEKLCKDSPILLEKFNNIG